MYQMSKFPFLAWNSLVYNCLIAAASSVLCFSGWWVMIDSNVMHKQLMDNHKVYHLPGIASTLALILINCITNEALRGSLWYEGGACTPRCAKFLFFVGCTIAFGAMIGAAYIMINDFLLSKTRPHSPGYAVFFQNLLILASNMLMRFARMPKESF